MFGFRLKLEALRVTDPDPWAGIGADTPSAFANFESFCGERGERGMRAASVIAGLYGAEPSVLRFGMAGAVNGETYSPVAGG